jgi:LPS-assembly protein
MHRGNTLTGPKRPFHKTVLVLLLLLVASAYAQPAEATDESADAWHISADQLSYDQATDSYEATGNVSITGQGKTLTADRVLLNQTTRQTEAWGNVELISNRDRLTGEQLQIDLDTETGVLTDGSLFTDQNHLYLFGDQIRKTGPATYQVSNATITSCDAERPAWKITATDLKITVEGYGVAKHAALWASRVPVIYTPYFIFPVKLERQSGLLTPQLGQSQRKGTEYMQPLYWAINESSDATFYTHIMSERGIQNGIEYRYISSPQSYGALMVDGFIDSKVDDGQGDASKWGYTDGGTDVLRPNEDRYWIRGKANQELPAGFTAKLDIDVVSDQDYLHEFRSTLNGFEQTMRYFEENFGRDLDDYTDPIRTNRLNLSRLWNRYSLNMDLRWNDNVIKRRFAETDNTLQQLPAITFTGVRQKVGASPLYYDFASRYTYFYRQDGERGHRTDIYPRLYYPFFLFQGWSLEPSAGIRQTTWRVDPDDDNLAEEDEHWFYRTLYDAKINVKTEFFRVFDVAIGGYDRMKHTIRPEMEYAFIPDDDQSDLPYFDSLDRIERKNLITLAVTNTFTLRTPRSIVAEKKTFDYLPFLRFKMSQGFDINKYNEDDPEPFEDLEAELQLTPRRWISIDADAARSWYTNRFNSYNVGARLWDRRGDSLSATYRFTREDLEEEIEAVDSIYLNAQLVVDRHWRLRGVYEANRVTGEEIQSGAGITYQSQCWAVDFDYSVEDQDQSVAVMFHLMGLGSFGS